MEKSHQPRPLDADLFLERDQRPSRRRATDTKEETRQEEDGAGTEGRREGGWWCKRRERDSSPKVNPGVNQVGADREIRGEEGKEAISTRLEPPSFDRCKIKVDES